MTATYRLIHFCPDPFTGARFALGAVVSHGADALSVAKAERIPSAQCLGSASLATAVQMVHEQLHTIRSATTLPPVFGPYVSLGEPAGVPKGAPDPKAWVHALLNAHTATPSPGRVRAPKRRHRSTYGYRFFKTVNVDRYVKKTFKPKVDAGAWLRPYASGLKQITYWVQGAESVLLMEPIVPTRDSFDTDIETVAERFGAYRYAMEQARADDKQARLVAYVTAGGHPDQHAEAIERLARFAHQVVDTPQPQQRAAFVEQITLLGASGADELPVNDA